MTLTNDYAACFSRFGITPRFGVVQTINRAFDAFKQTITTLEEPQDWFSGLPSAKSTIPENQPVMTLPPDTTTNPFNLGIEPTANTAYPSAISPLNLIETAQTTTPPLPQTVLSGLN